MSVLTKPLHFNFKLQHLTTKRTICVSRENRRNMPALTSPWFYQRNPQLPPQLASAAQTRSPSTMTEEEVDQITKRVGRPTQSSQAKLSQAWKLENTFMETGRHSWAKMDLYADCKKCMWKDNGVVKSTCKIRPVQPTPR